MIFIQIALASFLAGALNSLTGSFGGALLMLSFVALLGTEDSIALTPYVYLAIGWQFIYKLPQKAKAGSLNEKNYKSSDKQKYTGNRNFIYTCVTLAIGSFAGVWLYDYFFKNNNASVNVFSLQKIVAGGFILFGLHYIFYLYFEAKPKLKQNNILNMAISLIASGVSACIGFFEQPILDTVYDRTYSQNQKDFIISVACYFIAICKCILYIGDNIFYKGLIDFALVGLVAGFVGAMIGKKYEFAIYNNHNLKLILSLVFVLAGVKYFWF